MIEAHRTRLPQYLAVLYGLMIVYASLEPFSGWMAPLPDTPFFLFAPWPPRIRRFDVAINMIAYAPLGFFVALIGDRRSAYARFVTGVGVAAILSFTMETAQAFLPTRESDVVDFVSNTIGATFGAAAAWPKPAACA